MGAKKQKYTKNSATSNDGTIIGYRQMGSGPGIILMHGGIQAAQNLMKLGTALSDEFTVYIPDRRGRGLSGAFGDNYGQQKETEDLDALLKKTGAHYLFGVATGALIILQSSLTLPSIHKVALYEPHLYVNKSEMERFNQLMQRMDKEIAEGKLKSAMVTGLDVDTKVSGDKPPYSLLYHMPRSIWKLIFAFILAVYESNTKGDDVQLKDLMPTLHYDLMLVNETEGKLESFKDVSAEVLLLGGSKSPLILKHSLDGLNKVLPHVHRIELKGLDHKATLYGKPEIARELKKFFL
ncbi:MAG: alpha/beta hydrolase [Halobacteriota archaeon]|jgi:pimeloyl-ACP methyl ester carboxylesterase